MKEVNFEKMNKRLSAAVIAFFLESFSEKMKMFSTAGVRPVSRLIAAPQVLMRNVQICVRTDRELFTDGITAPTSLRRIVPRLTRKKCHSCRSHDSTLA